ncbi:uncharacterized protein CEXT_297701 [Caerostris extrusa]|uniref:CUB domain-containing protein n=1 Tax=Caerostris extrusa TaxID=172846 RepID=A0AAV4QB77_CAEEX|nr:uncharacterized protein CEXT_297701 [Caerostris extrusa]
MSCREINILLAARYNLLKSHSIAAFPGKLISAEILLPVSGTELFESRFLTSIPFPESARYNRLKSHSVAAFPGKLINAEILFPVSGTELFESRFLTSIPFPESDEGEHCNRTVDIYQSVSSPPVTDENRNRPLHCYYRIRVRPPRNDWVVFVRFTRLRVGEPSEDRKKCIGGYVQIIDGYRESNFSNKEDPGHFCGEIDSPKTFCVHARYGQYAQLYPHRRGVVAPGSYCDRTFHGCAPTRCYVQSPGYPGVYPRNLRCRYNLVVTRSVVALAMDMNAFDVDGLRCDNLLQCFPRPVTKDPTECPFDYVKVYDGPTEESPLIVTLCGRGRLKSQLVASGPEMLVEFVTSNVGPLLNTGFYFKAESIYSETESEYEFPRLDSNGTCAITKRLRPGDVFTFGHLRSWYPVNTTCTYRFTASSDEEVLKLSFEFFRMERVTLCNESLEALRQSHQGPIEDHLKVMRHQSTEN